MQPPVGRLTRLATFVLLLAGGIVLLLFAVRLTAAALGWSLSPFTFVPESSAARAWLLALAVAACGFLTWLVLRHGDDSLRLPGEAGDVAVSQAALERLADEAARRDPDVVRTDAGVRLSRGRLRADVWVYGRPLAERGRLGDEVGAQVRAALVAATGLGDVDVRVHPRVLRVRQLARYLP